MKFKSLKAQIFVFLIIVTSNIEVANANLINSDLIANSGDNLTVTDTYYNHIWLDFTNTIGMTAAEATEAFPLYRIAKENEVALIYNAIFRSVYDFDNMNSISYNVGDPDYWKAEVYIKYTFAYWFGATDDNSSRLSVNGFFIDAANENTGISLARVDYRDGKVLLGRGWLSINNINDIEGQNHVGWWMVRDISSTVPEPSTLAIFALGIMGLASRRFKKQY